MPTYGAELSKVSNSYDKFRQTEEAILGNEGGLVEKSGWNQWPQPLVGDSYRGGFQRYEWDMISFSASIFQT
jgi:hypothetical protein